MTAKDRVNTNVPRKVSTVVLTGAGFSKDAGLPLTWEIVRRGRELLRTELGLEFIEALDDVAYEILEEKIGNEIEGVLTRLKVLEFYSAKYSTKVPGSPEDSNYKTKLLQLEMGIYFLVWATLRLPSAPSQPYDDFIGLLGNDVAFASLNYDLVLETLFQRNRRTWYYPLQDETKLFNNELRRYSGSFYTNPDEDPHSVVYLKLHGSFNWYFCWRCDNFNVVSDPDTGIHCTLLRKGRDPVSAGRFRNCNSGICGERRSGPGEGQAMLKPLIIPPTRMKEYSQAPINRHWAFFDRLLAQAQQIILVGTSVRDEDGFLVNSLTLLQLKNPQLERIVVIDPNQDIAAKVETLAEVETKWYPNLKAYTAR